MGDTIPFLYQGKKTPEFYNLQSVQVLFALPLTAQNIDLLLFWHWLCPDKAFENYVWLYCRPKVQEISYQLPGFDKSRNLNLASGSPKNIPSLSH